MKRRYTSVFTIYLFFLSVIGVPLAAAQVAGDIPLQIQLRYSDGSAVSGEPITLQRLPDLQETTCTTDANGRCSWSVARGLYQVIFSQPLDAISSLAVAEGGLDGFGLTVGDRPITYDFTFHHDDHVYFDAAPEAAVPDPIIPTDDSLHGGVVLTAVPSMTVGMAAVTPLSEEGEPLADTQLVAAPDGMVSTSTGQVDGTPITQQTNPFWRLLLVVILGLALGGGLHLWSRQRQQKAAQTAEQTEVEQRITTFILSPQTGADVSTTAHSPTQTGGSEC